MALLRSYVAVRRHQYTLHRPWMIRLNAVFLGVTLSRPVVMASAIALVSGKSRARIGLSLLISNVAAVTGFRPESGRSRFPLGGLLGRHMEIYGVLRIRCRGVARHRGALRAWKGFCSSADCAQENITDTASLPLSLRFGCLMFSCMTFSCIYSATISQGIPHGPSLTCEQNPLTPTAA